MGSKNLKAIAVVGGAPSRPPIARFKAAVLTARQKILSHPVGDRASRPTGPTC